jgi:hypothetical protein
MPPSIATVRGSCVRILATFFEIDDRTESPKALEIDVSREKGIWRISDLLASGRLEEIRFVGDDEESIGVVRMLVRAGKLRSPAGGPRRTLRGPGDESYPRLHPFVHICPRPDAGAFR